MALLDTMEKRGTLTAGILLLALLTAVYARLCGQHFINLDDHLFVVDNIHIRNGLTLNSVWWALTTTYPDYWHPMVWLSYMTDISLFGSSAQVFKLVNAGFHFGSAMLLFTLLRKTTRAFWPSLLTAALFIAHPLNVESVAWVTERKDVLFLFFGLLSLHVYTRFARTRSPLAYGAALLLFACGLTAKVTLITLPGLMLLFDFWPLERTSFAGLADRKTRAASWRGLGLLCVEKVPFLLLSIALVAAIKLHTVAHGADGVHYGARQLQLADWLFAHVLYLWKLTVPMGLTIYHPLLGLNKELMAAVGAGTLLIGSAAALLAARRAPYVATGWFWFVVALLPTMGTIAASGLQAAMYDRFMYLPAVGLYTALAFGAWNLCHRWLDRRAFIILGAAAIMALAAVSWRLVGTWQDTRTLFTRASEVSMDNWLAYKALGQTEMDLGNYEEAARLLHRSLAIEPGASNTVNELAKTYFRMNDWDKVRSLYDDNIARHPESTPLHNDYGSLLMDMGEFREALPHLTRALDSGYLPEAVHHNLATCYYKMGDLEAALRHSDQANRLKPGEPNFMYAQAVINARLGRMDRARDILEAILRIDPADEPARQALRSVTGQ
jgi:tetratricopeptide (TPR) repeat protein